MLNLAQNVVLLLVICFVSLGCTLLLNRLWPCEKRPNQNDLICWQLSILGTTYAVILGFMLYAVWNEFETARVLGNFEPKLPKTPLLGNDAVPNCARLLSIRFRGPLC